MNTNRLNVMGQLGIVENCDSFHNALHDNRIPVDVKNTDPSAENCCITS